MSFARALRAFAVTFAAVGAALLVIQWAHGRMFWLDEEMIAINLRDRAMAQLAGPLSLAQAAPYGWLVLERALLLLFGPGERVLRFLPMACGGATLATAVWIGRRWMAPAGAATLAYLCAFGQWLSFHALELKHYSADAFFALLLPALAVRATESQAEPARALNRRVLVWWIVAALAQWIANGALFVAPSCALVLVLIAIRRSGWRAGLLTAAPGVLWLASFALNYTLTLGPARANDFLREFWRNAIPPSGATPAQVVAWLAAQLAPLAIKPGGSGLVILFWTAVAAGFALARGYTLAFRLAFALVPVSAFVWAGIRLVPLYERLSLWIVPALYVGIAMAAETVVAFGVGARARREWLRLTAAAAGAALFVALFVDVYRRGMTYVHLGAHVANHDLDDRGAVGWLARRAQPGDVWLTTKNALPALWWYADLSETDPIVEASYQSGSSSCGRHDIGAWIAAATPRRILIYLGFGHDTPREFDDALLARLSAFGTVKAYRPFGISGHAIIVELGTPALRTPTLFSLSNKAADRSTIQPDGCIGVEPARRW